MDLTAQDIGLFQYLTKAPDWLTAMLLYVLAAGYVAVVAALTATFVTHRRDPQFVRRSLSLVMSQVVAGTVGVLVQLLNLDLRERLIDVPWYLLHCTEE